MSELNLDQLRTLVTIAKLGSFAAAARTLHLAAPTVSLHVFRVVGLLPERAASGRPAPV